MEARGIDEELSHSRFSCLVDEMSTALGFKKVRNTVCVLLLVK